LQAPISGLLEQRHWKPLLNPKWIPLRAVDQSRRGESFEDILNNGFVGMAHMLSGCRHGLIGSINDGTSGSIDNGIINDGSINNDTRALTTAPAEASTTASAMTAASTTATVAASTTTPEAPLRTAPATTAASTTAPVKYQRRQQQ